MDRNLYRVIGFVLVTIVGLIGVAALLHIVISLPIRDNKGPEWIGAIGTVATLIGTIYLATSEARRRDKEDLVKARLHGASMVLRLQYAEATISEIITFLEEIATVDGPATFLHTCKAKLETIDIWSIEDLIPLTPLPASTGLKLAQAADHLRAFARIINRENAIGNIYVSDPRKKIAKYLHENLSFTLRLISEARVVCWIGIETTSFSTN